MEQKSKRRQAIDETILNIPYEEDIVPVGKEEWEAFRLSGPRSVTRKMLPWDEAVLLAYPVIALLPD